MLNTNQRELIVKKINTYDEESKKTDSGQDSIKSKLVTAGACALALLAVSSIEGISNFKILGSIIMAGELGFMVYDIASSISKKTGLNVKKEVLEEILLIDDLSDENVKGR